MRWSEQINELAAAMSKAQAKIKHAPKDSANPFYKSTYADLASVSDACRDALTENGIAVIQGAETANGAVEITTRIVHSSGQWSESTLALTPTKNDPQGVGSAITYGRRYGLCAMVGVVADVDDDGNGNAASAPAKKQQQKRDDKKPEPLDKQGLWKLAKPLVDGGRIGLESITAMCEEKKGDYQAVWDELQKLGA